jgi:peptide/nickel transport system permease protein
MSEFYKNLKRIRKNRKAMIGLIILTLVILTAVFAPWISPHNPSKQDISKRLKPPWFMGGEPNYLLGTDALGQDILSRVIYGARVSLIVGIASVLGAGMIGFVIGIISGYFGGIVDSVVMRIVDLQMAIPFLVLAIAVMAILEPGLGNIIIVLIISGWVRYARIARAQTLVVKKKDFVMAAVALGSTKLRLIFSDILPNIVIPVLVVSTLEVGQMILAEAALSFLGLGIQPPTPSWGGMVADGRDYLSYAWWVSTFPGLAILITVFGINFFGDWVRDSFDPKLRPFSSGP